MPDYGTFPIKRNDTLPNFRLIGIQWGDGTDMTFAAGDTAKFHMYDTDGNAVVPAGAVTLDVGQNSLTYPWQVGDTATEGTFLAEVEITFAAGGKTTIPVDGYYRVSIAADLDGS